MTLYTIQQPCLQILRQTLQLKGGSGCESSMEGEMQLLYRSGWTVTFNKAIFTCVLSGRKVTLHIMCGSGTVSAESDAAHDGRWVGLALLSRRPAVLLEVMRPLVCPLWSQSWIISHVAQPFSASAFTLTSPGGWKSEREVSHLALQTRCHCQSTVPHTDTGLAAVQTKKKG